MIFPCTECGYPLVDPLPAGRCSECGASADRAIHGRLLQNASTSWQRGLRWGCLLGMVATILFAIRDWAWDAQSAQSWIRSQEFINATNWLAIACWMGGVWLRSRLEPRRRMEDRAWIRSAVICVLIFGTQACSIALGPTFQPLDSIAARTVDRVLLPLVAAVGYVMLALMWIDYARRVPSRPLVWCLQIVLVWTLIDVSSGVAINAWQLLGEWRTFDVPNFGWLYKPRQFADDAIAIFVLGWLWIVLTRLIRRAPRPADPPCP